jgi:hypothetical protein
VKLKGKRLPSSSSLLLVRDRRHDQHLGAYVSPRRVHGLLAKSLEARQERLSASDMITAGDAALLVNANRATIENWIVQGRAIGLSRPPRGFCLPRWQFEPPMWAVIPALSAALGTREGWALLCFLESPQGGLDGRTPRQVIEQGQSELALAAAEHEGN